MGSFINDTLYYDKRGLVTSASTGYRSDQGSGVTAMGCNGLGAVATRPTTTLAPELRPSALRWTRSATGSGDHR